MPNLAKRFASNTELFNTPIQNETAITPYGSDFVDERKYNIDASTLTGSINNYAPYYGYNVDKVAIPADIDDDANVPRMSYDYYKHSRQGFVFDMVATKAPLIQYSNYSSWDTPATPNTNNHNGGYFDNTDVGWHRQQGYLVSAANYTTGTDPVTDPGVSTMRIMVYGVPFLADVKNSQSQSIYDADTLGFNFLAPTDTYSGTPGSNRAEEIATNYLVTNTPSSPATLGGSTLLLDVTDTDPEYFRTYSGSGLDDRVTDVQFVRWGVTNTLNSVPAHIDVVHGPTVTRFDTGWESFTVPAGGLDRTYTRLASVDTNLGTSKTHFDVANITGRTFFDTSICSFEWAENGYNVYVLAIEQTDTNHSPEYCLYRLETETPYDWGSLTQQEVMKTGQGNGNFGLTNSIIGGWGGKVRLNRGYQQEVRQNGQGNPNYESPNYNLKITVCIGGEQFDNDKIATKGHVYTVDTGSGTVTLDGGNTESARYKRYSTMWDERLCKGISRSKGGFIGAQGVIEGYSPSLVYLKHGDLPQVHEKIPQVILGFVDVQKGYDYFLRSIKAPPPVKVDEDGNQYSIGDLVLQGKDRINDPEVEALSKYYTDFSSENVNGTLPPYETIDYSTNDYRRSELGLTTAVLWSPDGTKLIWYDGNLYQVTCTTPFDLSTADWTTRIEKQIDIGPDTSSQNWPATRLKWVKSTHYPNSLSSDYDTYEHGLAIGFFGQGQAFDNSLRPSEFFKGKVNSDLNYSRDRLLNYEEVVLTPAGSGANQATPFTLEDKTVKSAYFRHSSSEYRRKRISLRNSLLIEFATARDIHKWDRSLQQIVMDPVVGAPNISTHDLTRFYFAWGLCDFEWYDQGRKALMILNKTGPDEFSRYDPVRQTGSSPTMRRAHNAGDGHGQEIWIDFDFAIPYQFFYTEANEPFNDFRTSEFYPWSATQIHFNYIDYEQSHFRFSYLGATMCPVSFKLIDDGRKMVRMSDPGITQVVDRPWNRWVPNTLDEPSFATNNSFEAQIAKQCLFGPYSYMKSRKREVALVQKEGFSPQSWVSNPYGGPDWGAITAVSPDLTVALTSPSDYNDYGSDILLAVVDLTTNTVARTIPAPPSYTEYFQTYTWAYAEGGYHSRAIAKTGGVNYGIVGKKFFSDGGSANPTYQWRGRAYLFNLDTGALVHDFAPPDDPAVSGGSVQFGDSVKMIEYQDRWGDPGLIIYITAREDETSYFGGSRAHIYYYDVYNDSVTLLLSHDPHDPPHPTYGSMGLGARCLATHDYNTFENETGEQKDPDIIVCYAEDAYPGGRITGYPNLGNDQGRVKLGLLNVVKSNRYGPATGTFTDGLSTFEVDTPNIAPRPRDFGAYVTIEGRAGRGLPFGNQVIISALDTYTYYPNYDSVGAIYIFNSPNVSTVNSVTYSDPTLSPHVYIPNPDPIKPGLYKNWTGEFFRFTPLLNNKLLVASRYYSRFYLYERDGTLLDTWHLTISDLPNDFDRIQDSAQLTPAPVLYAPSYDGVSGSLTRNRFVTSAKGSLQTSTGGTTYYEGTLFQWDLDKLNLERKVYETRVPDTVAYYFDTLYWSSRFGESFEQSFLDFDTDPEGKRPIFTFGLARPDWTKYKYGPQYSDEYGLLQHNGKKNVRSD